MPYPVSPSRKAKPSVAAGRVRIWTIGEPDLDLRAVLGPEPPIVISGYAVYDAVARPGRGPLTPWIGSDALAIELSIILDETNGERSAAGKLRKLDAMAGINRRHDEPPHVRFLANMPVHDHARRPGREWVISNVEWGEQFYDDEGELVWWQGRVTLTLAVDSGLERLSGSAPFKTRTMRKGETLRKFAKRTLGDARRWSEIATLNRDKARCPTTPDRKIGRELDLKVPPREPVRRQSKGKK